MGAVMLSVLGFVMYRCIRWRRHPHGHEDTMVPNGVATAIKAPPPSESTIGLDDGAPGGHIVAEMPGLADVDAASRPVRPTRPTPSAAHSTFRTAAAFDDTDPDVIPNIYGKLRRLAARYAAGAEASPSPSCSSTPHAS